MRNQSKNTIISRLLTRRARPAARSQIGMTLLEIMIVLAIIALVMGFLVGPRVMKAFGEAKGDTAEMVVKQFVFQAYVQWSANNQSKQCPASLNDLTQYMNNQDIKDPWGNDFIMLCGPNAPQGAAPFAVMSKGEDGKQGTEDDIKSWEKKKN